jgi:hypothetical protein
MPGGLRWQSMCSTCSTSSTVIEQRAHMDMYEEQAIRTSLALERIGCENHILRQGTFGIHEKDLELESLYCCLSEPHPYAARTRPRGGGHEDPCHCAPGERRRDARS